MSFAKSFLLRFKPNSGSLALGLVLGLIAANALENSMPEAQAQQARITLSSLQQQVNAIISGSTPVGKVSWTNVINIPASIADGDDIGTVGAGLQLTGKVFSVNPNLTVTNLTATNTVSANNVSAGSVSGNGSGLTSVSASQLAGRPIISGDPVPGQSLKWNGTAWAPYN